MHFIKGTKAAVLLSAFAGATAAADEFDESALEVLPGMGSPPPVLGSNVDGGSVFANYISARKGGQFFLLWQAVIGGTGLVGLRWCGDLSFSDVVGAGENDSPAGMAGYTARCLGASLDVDADLSACAAQQSSDTNSPLTPNEFNDTNSLAAIYVLQSNVFEGEYQSHANSWVARFWDDGRPAMLEIDWDTRGRGKHPSKSSWSANGKQTWITINEAACLLKNNVDSFNPEAFSVIYEEVLAKSTADPITAVDEAGDTTSTESKTKEEGQENAAGNPAENAGGSEGAPAVEGIFGSDEQGSQQQDNEDVDENSAASNGRRLSIAVVQGIFSQLFG